MKNKKIKGLNKQFLFANIISLSIAIILGITFILYSSFRQEAKVSPAYLIGKSNELYVGLSRFVVRNSEGCKLYLKKLGRYYELNVAITDLDGNVIMKSENVTEDKIPVGNEREFLQEHAKNKNKDVFYKWYETKVDDKQCSVNVWKEKDVPSDNRDIVLLILCLAVIIITLLLYLFTNRKVKYINQIGKGVDEFSKGNLDYFIKEKGHDELYSLAKNSNTMAQNLKAMIEEEKRVQRLKTELITNVSHDLRTPLTSLIGYLQLVDNENIREEDRKKYAAISLEKAKGLNNLIEDLFNYSKLESGGIALEKSSVNIVEILEQSIGEASIDINEKEMIVQKNFSSKIIMANIDSMQMGRVFQNLLNNAIKYGLNKGEIIILASQLENKIYVSFENSTDNLIEDEVNLLFERFYRGDISRNSKVKGSGIGLAIAKSIVELHGGKIEATIKDGIFKVTVELSCYNSKAICLE